MEHIKDVLKTMGPGYDQYDVEIETLKNELIEALAHVRFSYPAEICILTSLTFLPPKDLRVANSKVSRSIVSSFERYSGGPQGKPQTATTVKGRLTAGI